MVTHKELANSLLPFSRNNVYSLCLNLLTSERVNTKLSVPLRRNNTLFQAMKCIQVIASYGDQEYEGLGVLREKK